LISSESTTLLILLAFGSGLIETWYVYGYNQKVEQKNSLPTKHSVIMNQFTQNLGPSHTYVFQTQKT